MPIKTSNRKRLLWLGLFLFTLYSLLVAQFYKIQILEGEKWTEVARRQHFFTVKEPFIRGTFISNSSVKKGHPEHPQRLVLDIQKFHLFIDPVSIPEEHREYVANQLRKELDLSVAEQMVFRQQFDRKSRSRKLAMWVSTDARDAILQWWYPYARQHKIARNALFFVTDYQRSYPFGKLLGQVLHTIQNTKDEVTKQARPTGGLEMYFNHFLAGKQGARSLMRSPRHSFETGEVVMPAENGADIHLTINHYLQAIAEEEVEKGVKKCKAKEGWAVMMDPKTGEVLALAQYPFFYPGQYRDYFNDPQKIEYTRVKAITDAHEPGSVMKAFTLAIALKANEELQSRGEPPMFDPEEKVSVANGRFPGRSKPIRELSSHRFVNMDMALQKSSNIYMARLGEKIVNTLGNEWYRGMLKSFGFGEKTGIELPAESWGVVPTPGKKHPNGRLEWSKPTPFSLAMGHNIQMTTMQLLRGFALFANGGYLVQPTLVRKVVKTNGDGSEEVLLDNTRPERVEEFPRIVDEATVARVLQSLKYVTKPGGGGRRGDILGYTEVGKTGTAEKIVNGTYSKTQNVATFVGFAPLSDPAFVLAVVMDEPEHRYIPGVGKNQMSGIASAPVFKEIAQRSLAYLGIPSDDPHGYPPHDPRYDPERADWIKEAHELREKYNEWNQKG